MKFRIVWKRPLLEPFLALEGAFSTIENIAKVHCQFYCRSPLPSPSPRCRRRSFIPGLGHRDKFAQVVEESLKLNGGPPLLKEVRIFCNTLQFFSLSLAGQQQ